MKEISSIPIERKVQYVWVALATFAILDMILIAALFFKELFENDDFPIITIIYAITFLVLGMIVEKGSRESRNIAANKINRFESFLWRDPE